MALVIPTTTFSTIHATTTSTALHGHSEWLTTWPRDAKHPTRIWSLALTAITYCLHREQAHHLQVSCTAGGTTQETPCQQFQHHGRPARPWHYPPAAALHQSSSKVRRRPPVQVHVAGQHVAPGVPLLHRLGPRHLNGGHIARFPLVVTACMAGKGFMAHYAICMSAGM